MALLLKDRVKETTTTTGTGTYTLAGAVTGFEAFSEIGDGNTTYYCCTDGTDFEVGVGTYTASGTTLARTTILQSSNGDAAVNWTSGSRTIFCTQPADKAVFLDASGNIDINGGAIDGVTLGTNSAVTELQVDNLNINGNIISSTNTNGVIALNTNNTGKINLNANVQMGSFNGGVTVDTNGTGDFTIQPTSNKSSVVVGDGDNGNISLTPHGTGSVVIDGLSYPKLTEVMDRF